MSPHPAGWTEVSDVTARLRRRWDRGTWLRDHAAGAEFAPVSVAVRGPRADEVLDNLDRVEKWVAAFTRDAERSGYRVETKIIRSRRLGSNTIPARLWLDSLQDLVRCLRVGDQLRSLTRILIQTDEAVPELRPWVVDHPIAAIEAAESWPEIVATVRWVLDHEPRQNYLRHIDLEAIDTKFIETNRLLLGELLDRVLPPDRIDQRYSRSDFAGRYGFLRRPDYVRFRVPADAGFPIGVTEATLRTDEFAGLEFAQRNVLVVENEASYLALPELPDTVIVFGAGFALSTLKAVLWLADRRLLYWGDIDTYGFAILDQLRARFSHVESILMDHTTLMAHRRQWVTEPKPTNQRLTHLTDPELELYGDLVEDRFGHHVRLEQERIRFHRVREAINRRIGPAPSS